MRPTIGITADYSLADWGELARTGHMVHFVKDALVRAVEAAGGLPLLVPCSTEEARLEEFLSALDGLIISGSGADIDPAHYGEEPHPALGRRNPVRLGFELALARKALAGSLPLLGLCGGHQTMNVAAGGTLYQDIESQLPGALQHKAKGPPSHPAHSVRVEEGSLLGKIVGAPTLQVNSTHHQAIKDVARSLKASAVAPDGIVEAVEVPGGRFVLGLQWHPEYMAERCPESRALFEAFVAAAKAHAAA